LSLRWEQTWAQITVAKDNQQYQCARHDEWRNIRYRAKSAFEAAPRLGIDRNAYARILNVLDMIERGT
jgi:hypothetical protein